MIEFASLPSFCHISGLLPDVILDLIPQNAEDVRPLLCMGLYRGERCERVVAVYTVPASGMASHQCRRCGHLNVLVDGRHIR